MAQHEGIDTHGVRSWHRQTSELLQKKEENYGRAFFIRNWGGGGDSAGSAFLWNLLSSDTLHVNDDIFLLFVFILLFFFWDF